MPGEGRIDPRSHPGCTWYENGQSALSGSLLELSRDIDRLFLRWAGEWGAHEYSFPTFLPARELAKLDYFRSFPHLVTFPVALDPEEANLERFRSQAALDDGGGVRLAQPAPIRDVLTPAACYHVYILFQGETLEAPRFVTTRATCFRREAHYAPLERQWSFSMREIVCIGSEGEVRQFLEKCRGRVEGFFLRTGLPVVWQGATDPFFKPAQNPKYLMQRLEPVKTEMVFDGRLAIGSVNFHQSTFGEVFGLRRGGKEAFSGCVAFGIERWVYAFLARFGPDAAGWPALGAAPSDRGA